MVVSCLVVLGTEPGPCVARDYRGLLPCSGSCHVSLIIVFSDLTLELGLCTVKEQMLPGFLVMFLV